MRVFLIFYENGPKKVNEGRCVSKISCIFGGIFENNPDIGQKSKVGLFKFTRRLVSKKKHCNR